MYPIVLGLAAVVAAPAPKAPPKKDPPSVVGGWALVTAVQGGKPEPFPKGLALTFAADGTCVVREGEAQKQDDRPETLTFSTDAKADPPWLDLRESEMGAKPMLGIYTLDGDTLTICLDTDGKDRPTGFSSPDGSALMLLTLKRVRKD